MKAVFEELNGDLAVFIVDGYENVFHIDASFLPNDAQIGDVFAASIDGCHLVLGDKLDDERRARLDSAQAKREALLRRNKK